MIPKLYEFGGSKLSLTDWSEVSGLPRHVITDRLKAGWSFAEAVVYLRRETRPVKVRRRRNEQQAGRA